MTTRILTAANRVNVLSSDLDRKWKNKNPLRVLDEKYRKSQENEFDFSSIYNRNLELIGNETIGPDDSASKILQHHAEKIRQIERFKSDTTFQRAGFKSAASKISRAKSCSDSSNKRLGDSSEQDLIQQARILSANRRVKSAQKEVRKFLNRAPPPRLIVTRGHNIDGIGFESDLNYVSINGVWHPANDNAVKVFAKDSDHVLVTSTKCAKVIATQCAAQSSKHIKILVGKNGILSNANKETADEIGQESGFNATKLSDTDYAGMLPGDVPLCWKDQLEKQNVVVKEAKNNDAFSEISPEEKKETASKRMVFHNLLEEEQIRDSTGVNWTGSKGKDSQAWWNQIKKMNQAGFSITDLKTVQPIRSRAQTGQGLKTADLRDEKITQMKVEFNLQNSKSRLSEASRSVSSAQSSPRSLPQNSKPRATRNMRVQTAKTLTSWNPTTLDIYNAKQAANAPPIPKGNFSTLRRKSFSAWKSSEGAQLNREYTSIVYPMQYKVAQKSFISDDNQVINVIIDADTDQADSIIGARLTDARSLSSALSSRPKSGPIFQPAHHGVASLGGSESSLVYSAMEKKLGASGSDINVDLADRPSSVHRSGSRPGYQEEEDSQVMIYSEGIHVQIASRAAVTNPPPAPTPEPLDSAQTSAPNSPSRRSQRRVRISTR